MVGKVAVMGLRDRNTERGSQARIAQVKGVKKRHLMPHVEAHVERGAIVNTDSLPTYCILDSKLGEKLMRVPRVEVVALEKKWQQRKKRRHLTSARTRKP